MRYYSLIICAALLALVQPAVAQDVFPSVKVAEMVADSVVSIDANAVAFSGITGGGNTEFSRTGTLSTRRLTGFIYSADGYIITDSRDIEGAALLTVRLSDGTEVNGKIAGVDPFYGIGVVKIDPPAGHKLKPVKVLEKHYDPLYDVYPFDQGDSVVAIGYSGGFGGTVTYGIISAIRNFRNRNQVLLPSVIQSDVVINTGNEGSPLFNENGEVIAVHERRGGGGSMQNTTFFTPIVVVKRVADEIIAAHKSGKALEVWHPWLGIRPYSGGGQNTVTGQIREVDDQLKMYMNIPQQYWDVGIMIDAVYPESPAREFGLMDKDMLMHVTVLDRNENEKHPYRALKSIQELELFVTMAAEGDIYVFGVLRGGKIFEIEVVVGQHPGEFNRYGAMDATGSGSIDSSQYF